MTTIAEFQIPAEEFALYETLERLPDLKVEVDRVVAHGTTHVMPFVWVSGDGFEEATSVFEADPSIKDVELLTELDEERFYQMSWTDRTQIIGHMLIERDATVQRAIASRGRWRLRVLFPDRDDLSATNDYAKENEFTLNLIRVYDVDAIRRVRYDLTDAQHEALTEAFEHGYFEVPRNIKLAELAKFLDISHQALSKRLRRANHDLIKNALLVTKMKTSPVRPLILCSTSDGEAVLM